MARKRKDPAAVALGRKRMKKLSAEQKSEFASAGGKESAKTRFSGMTAEQISERMKEIRAWATERKKNRAKKKP